MMGVSSPHPKVCKGEDGLEKPGPQVPEVGVCLVGTEDQRGGKGQDFSSLIQGRAKSLSRAPGGHLRARGHKTQPVPNLRLPQPCPAHGVRAAAPEALSRSPGSQGPLERPQPQRLPRLLRVLPCPVPPVRNQLHQAMSPTLSPS